MVMEEAMPAAEMTSAQVFPVDTMRDAMVANFEQTDLDVPAFLRKRGAII
jgi:hypothetical protein